MNTFYDASSQARGLVKPLSVLKAHPQHYGTVGVADLRLHTLQYTRLVIFAWTEVVVLTSTHFFPPLCDCELVIHKNRFMHVVF